MEHRLEWYDGHRLGLGDLRTLGWHETPRRVAIPRHRPAGAKLALAVAGSVDLVVEPPGRPGRRLSLVGGRFALLPQDWHLSGAADGRFFWASLVLGRGPCPPTAVRLLSASERAGLRGALAGTAGRPLAAGPALTAAAADLAAVLHAGAPRIRLAAEAARLRCRRVAEAVAAGGSPGAAWERAGFASRQAWRRAVAATGPDLDGAERR
jgi:hypothetical protein